MAFKWIGKSEDGNTITLKKLDRVIHAPDYVSPEWLQLNKDLVRIGIAIDVETTGLNRNDDQVIEIGLRKFLFNRENGDILSADEFYQGLQDPGHPLSAEIQQLTGLTDAMLEGQRIDWDSVNAHLDSAQLIIAHNAGFDRPFIDRNAQSSAAKIWGCSLKQIDWFAKGYTSQKLEILSIYHGFFTDAHRALSDVNALTYLLSHRDEATGKTYFAELLDNARRPFTRVFATAAPFESKDILKRRGYSWDTAQRVWSKSIFTSDLSGETQWLENNVYGGKFRGNAVEIPITDNFKSKSI